MSLKPSVANPQLHLGGPELTRHKPNAQKPEPDPDNKDKKSSSVITVLIAIGANFLIAIAKSVAAFITGSASMVAEAAHSWADTGNGIFLLVAEQKAVKPADKSHPLGYGKEAYVWSMIAAFGVFMAGSIVSIYTGITEWNAPEAETNYTIAFIILAVAFVLEGFSLVQAYLQSKKQGQAIEVSAIGYVVETSNPTLRGVFFEDLAAVTGLVIAAAAIFLISRNRDFLVGYKVSDSTHDYVLSELLRHEGVDSVSYLHLEWVGPKKIFMVAAVDVRGNQREESIAQIFESIESQFRANKIFQEAILTLSAPNAKTIAPHKSSPDPVRS